MFKMSFGKRWHNLNPYELHKTLINEYFLTAKNKTLLLQRDTKYSQPLITKVHYPDLTSNRPFTLTFRSKDKRDIDVIRENHQFLWEDGEEESLSWEKRLAKKYYDKLYKEYCVGDLSRYKENKIGLRWRTEQELIDGKGQFSCGSKRCAEKDGLRTWEVNFGYVEQGTKKNALVKLRLCPSCSDKLNYHHRRKEVKRLKHRQLKGQENPNVESKVKRTKEDSGGIRKEESEGVEGSSGAGPPVSSGDVWKQNPVEEEPESHSREEEFDKYLDELFL